MGKGKRILAWFLAAALTITSVNVGMPASAKAAEVKNAKYYQVVTGTMWGSGGQSSDTSIATVASGGTNTNGNSSTAPYIEGTTASSGGTCWGSSRIGCIQFDLPEDMDLTNLKNATVTLNVKSINNVEGTSQFTTLALYQTANPASVTTTDAATYPARDLAEYDNDYCYDAAIWGDKKLSNKVTNSDTMISSGEIKFDVTEALKTAYEDNTGKMVLRAQTPKAGFYVYNENSSNPPTLTIDATTETSLVVKYVDGEGNALAESKSVDVCVGSKYTYDISEEEKLIVKDGKTYQINDKKSTLVVDPVPDNTEVSGNEVSGSEVSGNEVSCITLVYDEVVLTEAAEEIAVVTRAGIAPVLPAKANAKYSSDMVLATAVEWEDIDAAKYASAGNFTVNGKFAGTDVPVTATVTVKSADDYVIAKYTFDEGSYADSTGKHADATVVGTVNAEDGLSGKAAALTGGKKDSGHLVLPNDLLVVDEQVQDDFTVSFFMKRQSVGNSFALTLHGDTNANYFGLVAKDSQFQVEYRKGSNTVALASKTLTPVNAWMHVAIVTSGSTGEAQLYLNGEKVAEQTGIQLKMSDITPGNNYIGYGMWAANGDVDYPGIYDEFTVYNTTLTEKEIKNICDPVLYTSQIAKAKEALTIGYKDATLDFDASEVTSDLNLPTTGAGEGTTIEWASDNAAVTTSGVVVQPSKGQEDAVVTLTATIKAGSYSDTKTFTVTVPAMAGTNFIGLETAVTEASTAYQSAVNKKIYTAASLKVWKDAIEKAEAVLATKGTETEAEAAEVATATEELNDAIANNALVVADLETMNETTLAAWYPLTSDAKDASGNGVDGEATGVTFDRATGAFFNGTKAFTSYIELPVDLFNKKDHMTISFWASDDRDGKQSNVFGINSGTNSEHQWDGADVGTFKQFYINTNDPAGYFRMTMNKSGWRVTEGFQDGGEDLALETKTWAHLTAVIDGYNLTVYKDGVSLGTKTLTQSISEIGDLTLAAIGTCGYAANGDWDYNGYVKDFRVYNAALAESQVKEIYDYMGTLPMAYAKDDLLAAVKTAVGNDNVVVADNGTVTLNISEDTVTLPITGVQGEIISWASANTAISVSNETGTATITLPGEDDGEVTGNLTATISLGGKTDTVIFATKVFYKNNTDVSALKTAVEAAEAKGYVAANYTTASWAAYTSALEAAKALVAQPPKTDAEVTAAKDALEQAEIGLVRRADRTALNAAIAEAEGKVSTAYTAASWAAVKTALEEAKAVDVDDAQSVVDAATEKLTTALSGLVELAKNKEALQTAIVAARDLTEADYTAASWAAVKTALEAAEAINKDSQAIQKDVDEKTKALNDAIKALVTLKEEAQGELAAAIADVEEAVKLLDKNDYTEASWAALEAAIKTAKDAKNSKDATVEDIEAAAEALQEAFENLEIAVADKTDLNAEIAKAEALTEADYTADSWKTLQTALTAAKAVAQDENANPVEVADALAALTEAIEALEVPAPVVVPADKTALNAAIADVEKLVAADYDAATWAALQTALTAAKAEAAKADSTQAAVDAAVKALTDAKAALKAAPVVTPEPTEVKVSSIKITNKNVKIAAGKSVKLEAEVGPENVTNGAVTWESSNTKYATVDSKTGVVKTTKKGAGKSVTITATAADGSGVKATIKVQIMKHAVKSIKLKASKTVAAGKKVKVKVTIKTTGKNANKTLNWTIKGSGTKYASVNSKGVVSTNKSGKGKKITVVATSTDGTNKKAQITIKIK